MLNDNNDNSEVSTSKQVANKKSPELKPVKFVDKWQPYCA